MNCPARLQRRGRQPGDRTISGSFVSVVALVAWIVTLLAGLFLLAIWLIEYDPDYQRAAATRLPVPVISSHATLATVGLVVWVGYLVTGDDELEWATLAILACVVSLGITMAVRWVKVYRAKGESLVPPERHFPLAVVITHGVLAFTTVTLVLLTTLGVGGA